MARVTWLEWARGVASTCGERQEPDERGLPQMTNQRASRVSFFVVVALAVLAVGAFVPKALAAQRETRCCVIDHGNLACAQYTTAHCSAAGGFDIGPGSCAHNPCTAATTTTGPSTTTTTSTSTSTTTTSTSTSTSTSTTTSTSTPTTTTATSTSTTT